ncbi:MAG: YaiI/YqxD family protein [Planctomycetota bacterium]|nr:MAG: YaiI/YqxD family protein [Planctomycetota bacterium]
MSEVYIDADACPVKAEAYRIASRHGLLVRVVANHWMTMPNDPMIRLEVVDDGFDAADDWIAERAGPGDVVITDDIPLAQRCLQRGAAVLTNRGEERSQASIGEAMAMRELMQYVREAGGESGGQKPMGDPERRRFCATLERLLVAAQRG